MQFPENVQTDQELLHEEVIYNLQTRQPGGEWQHLYTAHQAKTLTEAQETIDDLEALSEPGWEYRPVEIRRTLTALPHQPAAAAEPEPGPVPVRRLRPGYLISYRGQERGVWRVQFDRQSRAVRVYMVPTKDGMTTFTAPVDGTVTLLSTDADIDLTDQSATATR